MGKKLNYDSKKREKAMRNCFNCLYISTVEADAVHKCDYYDGVLKNMRACSKWRFRQLNYVDLKAIESEGKDE